jgi:hypothetical protein
MPFALLPLLLNLAPTVAEWIAGSNVGKATEKVAQIAKTTLGVDSLDGVEQALAADPDKALQFKLAVIQAAQEDKRAEREAEAAARQADVDALKAQLADIQSARAQTLGLAQAKSAIAWGAVVISTFVLIVFGGMLYFLGTQPIPPDNRETLIGLAQVLGTLVVAVVSYWVGSSAGSAQKTNLVETLARSTAR